MSHDLLFKVCFVGFAGTCLAQRLLEIKHHRKKHGFVKARSTLVAMTFAHLLFFSGSLLELFYLDHVLRETIAIAGIVIFSIGFLMRKWVIAVLGQFWSLDVEIRENHELIVTGPYAFCRHPNYLAILFELVGFCLIAHAYFTLMVSFPVYLVILFVRIRVEEGEMIKKFGERYVIYKKKTAALMPYVI